MPIFVANVSTVAILMTSGEHSPGVLCSRCGTAPVAEPLGLCGPCVVNVRVECVAGLRRLGEYLAAWAAFDDWLRLHGDGTASF
jgi:hypothetical protein